MSDAELIEPIEIELDKTRPLKITMRGMMIAERKLRELRGDPTLSLWTLPLAELNSGEFAIDTTMVLLWAGLVHEDKTLTFDQVLDMVTAPQDALLKVLDAFRRFYKLHEDEPDIAEVTDAADDQKKTLHLGLNSGHSPESNSD